MNIDYSKLTTDELWDVHENIDKERYPERYADLLKEIQKRNRSSAVNPNQGTKPSRHLIGDDEDDETFVIEFSSTGSKVPRILFISGFLALNVIFFAIQLPKLFVTSLDDVHMYSMELSSVECKKDIVYDEEDRAYTYFDLHIDDFEDRFSALGINEYKCRQLALSLSQGQTVSIWHKDGLIYQLYSGNSPLLTYGYLKPKIRSMQTEGLWLFWMILLFIWIFLFKSLVNAIVPGTFRKDD